MNPNIDAMNVSNIKSVSLFGAEQYRLRPLCVVCFVPDHSSLVFQI